MPFAEGPFACPEKEPILITRIRSWFLIALPSPYLENVAYILSYSFESFDTSPDRCLSFDIDSSKLGSPNVSSSSLLCIRFELSSV